MSQIATPRYDRSKLSAGIVHIGLGNFHRAHMAVYLDDLFNLGESHDWAIIGAGVRAPDSRMRDALKGQDCLSTIIELDPQGKTCHRQVRPDRARDRCRWQDPRRAGDRLRCHRRGAEGAPGGGHCALYRHVLRQPARKRPCHP